MSMEAYSVAIRLKLVDEVSLGIIGLSEKFVGLNTSLGKTHDHLSKIEAKLKNVKTLMLIGTTAMIGGGLALGLLGGPLKAANEYEIAFTKFKNLNLGELVNSQADQFARANKTMGVSSTEMMKTLAESVGLFGSYESAQKHAAQLASMNVANSAIYGGTVEGLDEGSTRALVKFIERRGGMSGDEGKYQDALNLAERMVTGSGGFIQFRDLAQFSQMGGTAFRGLSEKGVENMSLLLQEQGGAKAGTAMMSIYQNLIAGRTPVKTMNLLEQYGLGATHQIAAGTLGGKGSTLLAMDHVKEASLLQSDPATWFKTIFLPALAQHGVTSEGDILKATNDLLSNRNASGQGSIFTTQLLQVARDAKLTANALNANQATAKFAEGPNSKFVDLRAKKDSLETELGEAALPVIIPLLQGLIPVVKGLASLVKNFPTTASLLVGAFTGLALLAVAGGAIINIVGGLKAMGLVIEWFAAKTAATAAAEAGAAGMSGMGMTAAAASGSMASKAMGLLGKLGALTGVGVVAYEVTDLIANKWLGLDSKIADLFSENYDPNAKRPNFVQGQSQNRPVVVRSPVFLDGKLISDNTAGHLASAFKPSGGEMFDPTLTPAPVGLNFAQ